VRKTDGVTAWAPDEALFTLLAMKTTFATSIQRGVLILTFGWVFGQSSLLSRTSEQHEPPAVQSHIGKGYEFVQNGQFQQAAQEFQAALDLNPGLSQIRYQLGVSYFALQQWPESRREFERLQREAAADPAVVYYLGRLDLQEENLDGAISWLEDIVADPPFSDTSYYLGSAYLKKGKLAEAEKWLKQAVELNPRDFRAPERLARTYLKAGRRAEAEQIITTMDQLAQSRYVPPFTFALVYAGLGDGEAVFHWLEKAYEVRDIGLVFLPVFPQWDSFRSDKRFQNLVRRCGFPM